MFLASFLVIGVQTANFAYIWLTEYNKRRIIRVYYAKWGHLALFAMYALILFLMSKLFGALKVGYMRVQDVIIGQICSVVCSNAVAYLQLALIGRWKFLHHIRPMIRLTCVNLAVVILWVIFMRWIYNILYPPKSVIVIYDTRNPEKLLKNIASRRDKYLISEAVPLDKGIPFIRERILNHETCILGDMPSHERNVLVKYCFEQNIRCYCSPKISDIMLMSAEKIHMFDTPLLLMRNRGLTVEQQFDKGPVLYRQPRLTLNGRVFEIIKFRSMTIDSEKNGARLASRGDKRITPVGRVLRKIHFDELPQLFNIIKGDMSIVGPRPERPEIAAQYEKTIPEFSYRLKVKAGLTGYAQVYGKYNTKPYDKLKLDLTYIENYSFLLDLQLIATTVKVLFQKDNTEGVDQAQMTAADTQGETTDRRQLEKDVQNTVEEIRWQQQQSEMTKAPESLEQAAGLPSGVTAEEMAADQEPGLLVSVIMPVHDRPRQRAGDGDPDSGRRLDGRAGEAGREVPG